MIDLKKLYAGAILILIVLATGCIGTSNNTNPSSTSTGNQQSKTTSQWSPATWTVFDNDLTLDSQYSIGSPIQITKTSTMKINLEILNNANSISYIGVIPASSLNTWKENPEAATYTFITHHVKTGTYTAALSPGDYYVVIGYADPLHKTLTSGTEVLKAGEYVGIPIDLSNIIYAENVKATIDIREDLDINMFFTTSDEFNVYEEGGTPRIYTQYNKVKSGTYDLLNGPPSYATRIGPDVYYLVLDNTYSLITTKTIDYKVTADVVYPANVHLKIEIKETG